MVRKRDAWTRLRDRRRIRPKTPAPKTGWLISELAALSGQPRRTIGYYVQEGLLPRPAFRGTATRYGRLHLLRLLGIAHFQRQSAETLQQIRQRLDAMAEAELLAIAARAPSPALAEALHLAAPASTNAVNAAGATSETQPGASATAAAALPGEPWQRVALLPGLELWLAADASPAVRNIAQQIQGYCGRR